MTRFLQTVPVDRPTVPEDPLPLDPMVGAVRQLRNREELLDPQPREITIEDVLPGRREYLLAGDREDVGELDPISRSVLNYFRGVGNTVGNALEYATGGYRRNLDMPTPGAKGVQFLKERFTTNTTGEPDIRGYSEQLGTALAGSTVDLVDTFGGALELAAENLRRSDTITRAIEEVKIREGADREDAKALLSARGYFAEGAEVLGRNMREWAEATFEENPDLMVDPHIRELGFFGALGKYPASTLTSLGMRGVASLGGAVASYFLFGPIGAAAYGFGMEAGSAFNEGRDYLEEQYGDLENVPVKEWSDLVEMGNAVGAIGGFSEFIPISRFMDRAGLGDKFRKTMIRKLMQEGRWRKALSDAWKGSFQEGFQESFQELVQIAGQEAIGNDIELREGFERVMQGYLAGQISGGGAQFGISAASYGSFQRRANKGIIVGQTMKEQAPEMATRISRDAPWDKSFEDFAESVYEVDQELVKQAQGEDRFTKADYGKWLEAKHDEVLKTYEWIRNEAQDPVFMQAMKEELENDTAASEFTRTTEEVAGALTGLHPGDPTRALQDWIERVQDAYENNRELTLDADSVGMLGELMRQSQLPAALNADPTTAVGKVMAMSERYSQQMDFLKSRDKRAGLERKPVGSRTGLGKVFDVVGHAFSTPLNRVKKNPVQFFLNRSVHETNDLTRAFSNSLAISGIIDPETGRPIGTFAEGSAWNSLNFGEQNDVVAILAETDKASVERTEQFYQDLFAPDPENNNQVAGFLTEDNRRIVLSPTQVQAAKDVSDFITKTELFVETMIRQINRLQRNIYMRENAKAVATGKKTMEQVNKEIADRELPYPKKHPGFIPHAWPEEYRVVFSSKPTGEVVRPNRERAAGQPVYIEGYDTKAEQLKRIKQLKEQGWQDLTDSVADPTVGKKEFVTEDPSPKSPLDALKGDLSVNNLVESTVALWGLDPAKVSKKWAKKKEKGEASSQYLLPERGIFKYDADPAKFHSQLIQWNRQVSRKMHLAMWRTLMHDHIKSLHPKDKKHLMSLIRRQTSDDALMPWNVGKSINTGLREFTDSVPLLRTLGNEPYYDLSRQARNITHMYTLGFFKAPFLLAQMGQTLQLTYPEMRAFQSELKLTNEDFREAMLAGIRNFQADIGHKKYGNIIAHAYDEEYITPAFFLDVRSDREASNMNKLEFVANFFGSKFEEANRRIALVAMEELANKARIKARDKPAFYKAIWNKLERITDTVMPEGIADHWLMNLDEQGRTIPERGKLAALRQLRGQARQAGSDVRAISRLGIDRTQVRYSSDGRPLATTGPTFATLGMYRTFVINYLERLTDYAGLNRATGAYLGALATLGGIEGLPFAQVLDAVVRWLTQGIAIRWPDGKIHPEGFSPLKWGRESGMPALLRLAIPEPFEEDMIPVINNILFDSLLGESAGIDITRSVGIGDPFQFTGADIWRAFVGPVVERGARPFYELHQGRTDQALRAAVPDVLRNLADANDILEAGGFRSARSQEMIEKDPDGELAMLRAFGLPNTRLANLTNKRYLFMQKEAAQREMVGRISRKASGMILDAGVAKDQGRHKEAERLYRDASRELTKLASPNLMRSYDDIMQLVQESIKRKTIPWLSRNMISALEADNWAKLRDINRIFGPDYLSSGGNFTTPGTIRTEPAPDYGNVGRSSVRPPAPPPLRQLQVIPRQ